MSHAGNCVPAAVFDHRADGSRSGPSTHPHSEQISVGFFGRVYSFMHLTRSKMARTEMHDTAMAAALNSMWPLLPIAWRPPNALPFSCKPAAESAPRFYTMSLRRD